MIIFSSIAYGNMCFGCSKEPYHWISSFEYPQHMFLLRNKKNNFQLRTLIWGPAPNKQNCQYFLTHLLGFNICIGCSKKSSHWDGSFGYPQHMFSVLLSTHNIIEPLHEISNNVVVGATSKGSDQPVHMLSLTFASCLNILWLLSYWLNSIWNF